MTALAHRPEREPARVRSSNVPAYHRSRSARREHWFYLFIAPWLAGFVVFALVPIAATAVFSFTRYNMVSAPHWIGLDNYKALFSAGSTFVHSAEVTALYVFVSVPLQLCAGVIVAVLLNHRVPAMGLLRALFYLPSVIPQVSMSILWLFVFMPNFGLLSAGLAYGAHLRSPSWLGDPQLVMWVFVVISLWGTGNAVVLFLAGLQGIPRERYEAAALDGANTVQAFVHVSLPGLAGVILFNAVLGLVNAVQLFVPVYIMTDGGPGNTSFVLNLNIFRTAFDYSEMGLASAEAWILFIGTAMVVAGVFALARRWVNVEGG